MSQVSWRWLWDGPSGSSRGHLGLTSLTSGLMYVSASVRRPGHDLVVLVEPEAPPPRAGTLEVRASGLWVDAVEEEPGRRWTIGLEAFALEVEDAADEVGHRIPLGFDLEWEATGPEERGRTPARVHGEVLVGDAVLELAHRGQWAREGSWDPDADGWSTEGHH